MCEIIYNRFRVISTTLTRVLDGSAEKFPQNCKFFEISEKVTFSETSWKGGDIDLHHQSKFDFPIVGSTTLLC